MYDRSTFSKPKLPKKVVKTEDDDSKTLPKDQFKCTKCPFACDQKLVLERHETKHLVKAENQVIDHMPTLPYECLVHLVPAVYVLLSFGIVPRAAHTGTQRIAFNAQEAHTGAFVHTAGLLLSSLPIQKQAS